MMTFETISMQECVRRWGDEQMLKDLDSVRERIAHLIMPCSEPPLDLRRGPDGVWEMPE